MQQQFKKKQPPTKPQNCTAHNRLGDLVKVLRVGWHPLWNRVTPRKINGTLWCSCRHVLGRDSWWTRGVRVPTSCGDSLGERDRLTPLGTGEEGDHHHESIPKVVGSAAALFCPWHEVSLSSGALPWLRNFSFLFSANFISFSLGC